MKLKSLKTIIKDFRNEKQKKLFDSISFSQVNEILSMKSEVKNND